jgi:hypothetical protein
MSLRAQVLDAPAPAHTADPATSAESILAQPAVMGRLIHLSIPSLR